MADIASVHLHNRFGRITTSDALTTLFDLCLVVIDGLRPGQLQVLAPVVDRLDGTLGDACTFGVLAVGVGSGDAVDLAGPLAEQLAVFADPDASAATTLGVGGAPALVWIDTQPAVRAVVDGWDGHRWRPVLTDLARKLAWTKPLVPAPDDPAPVDARPFTVTATGPVRNLPSRASHDRKEHHDARLAA